MTVSQQLYTECLLSTRNRSRNQDKAVSFTYKNPALWRIQVPAHPPCYHWQRSRERTEDKAGKNGFLQSLIRLQHEGFHSVCNQLAYWVALAQCPSQSAISSPNDYPPLCCPWSWPCPIIRPRKEGCGRWPEWSVNAQDPCVNYEQWRGRASLRGLGKEFSSVPREPPISCPSGRGCGLALNLLCVLAAANVVLFIIIFIWSNCFLKPSTSSMQIACIPDFLSKIKPTMSLLCKQSLSTLEHFSSFPLKTKP